MMHCVVEGAGIRLIGRLPYSSVGLGVYGICSGDYLDQKLQPSRMRLIGRKKILTRLK